MPSKGSPLIAFRLPKEVLAWIDECVAKSQEYTIHESYTRSSWVRAAIMERFDKYRRAKEAGQRARAKKQAAQAAVKLAEVEPPAPTVATDPVSDLVEELRGNHPL